MLNILKKMTLSKKQLLVVAIFIVGMIFAFRNNAYVLSIVYLGFLYVILVSGLDILLGYTGMMNTGQTSFYAIGAYTSALLSLRLGLPVFLTMIIGAVVASFIGYLLAFGTARLVKHFLVITTSAFAQVVYSLVCNLTSITNGFGGIRRIPVISLFGIEFRSPLRICILYSIITMLFLIAKERLVDSRTGRAFLAIRDNTVAASGVGINVNHYKRMSFAICAFYAGFAGGMYAHAITFISPESFNLNMSLTFLTVLLLGGRGNLLGSVIGAFVLCLCQAVLQPLGQTQAIVYGGLLLIITLFFPAGLYGMGVNVYHAIKRRVRH